MNPADALVCGILERPDDAAARLVYADWLEEQDDPESRARAALLRLQVRWEQGGAGEVEELPQQAEEILLRHPRLVGPLRHILGPRLMVLDLGSALALFLSAAQATADESVMPSGSQWQGWLGQRSYRFPTTFRVRRREGNELTATMSQDFTALYAQRRTGTFDLEGVLIAGRWLGFVTHGGRGSILYPGLYLAEQHRGWLRGTWQVPDRGEGRFSLRRRLPKSRRPGGRS
jgi:uncharacterized protein (TIGR02996 family)